MTPTAEGQAVGAVEVEQEPILSASQPSDLPSHPSKPALVGECLDVVVKINDCAIPFVLDTGSQVTL